jgi:O-antigen/teichoic acid export membrane protein
MSQRYLGNTFYSLIFFCFQLLVSLWSSPLIINSLGKQNYGIIVVVNTMSVFGWLSLMDFGLQGALTKHLADAFSDNECGRERSMQLFQMALSFYVLIGLVASAVVLVLSLFPMLFSVNTTQYSVLSRAFIVVAIFNFLFFPLICFAAVAEGLQEYRTIKLISALVLLSWGVSVYLLAEARAGVLSFLVADYVKTLLQNLLLLVVIRKKLPWLRIALRIPKFRDLKSLVNLSVDLFVSRITGIVFNQTDVLIITIILGQTALVTDYYSANALFMTVIGVSAVFNTAVVSETAWLNRDHSINRIKVLAEVGTRVSSAFVLPVAAAVFVWAPDILRVWLGHEFEKNGLLLRLMMIALIPIVSSGITSTLLVGIDRLRGVLWVPIFSVLINLVISLAGIKPFGIVALGAGTTLAYVVGSLLYNRYCLAILESNSFRFYRETMAKPLVVSFMCGAAGFWVKSEILIENLFQMITIMMLFLLISYALIFLLSSCYVRRELLAVIGIGRSEAEV